MDPLAQKSQPVSSTTPPINPPPSPAVEIGPKKIRTFQGDLADAIQHHQASAVKIAIAESKRSTNQATIGTKKVKSSKKGLVLTLSILFILLGGGVLFYVYYYVIPHGSEIAGPTLVLPAFIDTDVKKEIPTDTGYLPTVIVTELKTAQLSTNEIENIVFTKNIIDTETNTSTQALIDPEALLTRIGAKPPAAFVRSLSPQFMFGIHHYQTNEPFIIFKTSSFENAYAGMLKWEPTMYEELKTSLGTNSTNATSTPTTTAEILAPKTFVVDMVIQNKDVRVIQDQNSKILLMYSFIDKNTLIITTNETTLRELLARIGDKAYQL